MTVMLHPNLLNFSEEEFRDIVDRELRKDQSALSQSEREDIYRLATQLRQPAVWTRWESALLAMKKSAETQLGARKSELKKLYGTIPINEYLKRRRGYENWRAGNMRFLNGVEDRLLELRSLRTRAWGHLPHYLARERDDAARDAQSLLRAILVHRSRVEADYDPTDADLRLWAVIERIDVDDESAQRGEDALEDSPHAANGAGA